MSFWSRLSCSLALMVGSVLSNMASTAVAPPCTLFSLPCSARIIRSRRTVDSEVSSRCASSVTVAARRLASTSRITANRFSASITPPPFCSVLLFWFHYNTDIWRIQAFSIKNNQISSFSFPASAHFRANLLKRAKKSPQHPVLDAGERVISDIYRWKRGGSFRSSSSRWALICIRLRASMHRPRTP